MHAVEEEEEKSWKKHTKYVQRQRGARSADAREKKEEKHRSACMHTRIERGPPTSGVRENNISRPIGKVNFSNLRLVQVMWSEFVTACDVYSCRYGA